MRLASIPACLVLFLFLVGASLPGQAQSSADERNRALNRYVGFTNECLHLLYTFRGGLESLNRSVIASIEEDDAIELDYGFEEFYREDRLFTFLQGSCERTSPTIDQGLELEVLYQRTKQNQSLAESERLGLNSYRDQTRYLLLKFLEENYRLVATVGTNSNDKDREILLTLDRIERIYGDVDSVVSNMRTYLEEITPPVPPALQPFSSLATTGEALMHALQAGDNAAINASRLALGQSIEAARRAKLQYASQLRQLGIQNGGESEQAYDHAVEYGELLLQRSEPGALASPVRNSWTRHESAYYHYNIRLLDIYNHHKYGLTSYYKSLIEHSNRVFLHPLDITPWFTVIHPRQPEPAPVIETPAPAVVIEIDDSETETLTLVAAPTNNLVFLIDVSASMNGSDKLPVFKENLEFLVSLFRPEDNIAIVTFSENASIVLDATSGSYPAEIKSAIRGIRTGGETRVKKGFKEAYRIAEEQFIFNGTNRVILITDGIFDTDRSVESTISRSAGKGIQLSVMLVGRREATPVKARLSQLAELGEGRYSHMTTDNAKQVLVSEAKGE